MLCFPQLATGANAQFPLSRTIRRRTVVNETRGGALVKLDDPRAACLEWNLSYRGLTDAEREAIEALHIDAEGRLRAFVFLDPCGNLLTWSEDLSRMAWQKDGAIQVSTGVTDPMSTERALRLTNTSQATQGIQQQVDVPGWYHYCFSICVRAATRTKITLSMSNAGGDLTSEHFIDGNWTTCTCSGAIDGSAEDLTCRLTLEAGSAVEVFGFALEAQPNPSAYRKTEGHSGVYPNSRFAEDELHFVANGIDDHAVEIRVFCRTGEL